ncbi:MULTISPECIES: TetR/AcrR family transcriptional regulator [unclassified Curtobacterium]|uniref:TetR/AcrR family transcriptional regulator n=1 Tax=unclassified Curtobacterium TaxID=257496 RepID=UPI003A80AABA
MAEQGYAKGRAKRAEIIERAAAALGESGYRGASLRDIAARCGISHTGLLHYFRTKEALLIAVLEHRDQQDAERFFTPPVEGLEHLRRMVTLTAFNETQRGPVELFCVLSAEATAPEHPAHEYFVARYRDIVIRHRAAYDALREQGVLREGVDPLSAARELIAMSDGLQLQWLLDPSAMQMAPQLHAHIESKLTMPL